MRALTAAALALPGLTQPPAHAAEGDEASFQYNRYEEGERELFGARSNIEPIRVDSLLGRGSITLFDRLKFTFNYMQDTWSGATPIATAPLAFDGNRVGDNQEATNPISGASPIIDGSVLLDEDFNVYKLDLLTDNRSKETRTVHTIASASPETRKQGDFRLGYEWNEAALELGGGISLEDDYESRWGNANVRLDFNQKRTTLNLGLSYTDSDIAAILNPDASSYFDRSAYDNHIDVVTTPDGLVASRTLRDDRHDWSARFGLTQILNKDALIETSFGYTRSTGFMENPYKVVQFLFVDPAQEPIDFGIPGVPPLLTADVRAVLEQRPDTRNQWTWNTRFAQYFTDWDAALHLDYRFFHDDWGINAHTFEAAWGQPVGGGWTITPRVRYYTQDQADFYQPFFLFNQAEPRTPARPNVSSHIDFSKIPITDFSSDHRLSGYGALSGGLTVSKQFAKGVELEAGFEYYTHQGDLKLGDGGEGDFADFDNFVVNAGLKVDLSAPILTAGSGHTGHADDGHTGHSGGHAPAGVMFDHMLPKAGDFMVGYRYMYSRQDGDTLRGTDTVSDAAILANACGEPGCSFTSVDMDMHMHMLDIMYAPTDWLNLMLMPQFVDMDMTLRPLEGAAPDLSGGGHQHGGGNAGHATGGVGDTSMAALFKLLDVPGHHLHLGVGLSAPTGAVDEKTENGTFLHYHMQLGSGTWDFRPSLTYTGHLESWSWGGQLSGTKRLEDENESGFTFGDIFQATAWGSYSVLDWLSASVRGVYTTQGEIEGEFDGPHEDSIPLDFPSNYGGKYWDVGFGLSAVVPIGDFKGNRLSVEWLEPVEDDVNGFQLEREGTLSVSWSVKF